MASGFLHPLRAGALAPPTGASSTYSEEYALDADFKMLSEASQFYEPLHELQKKLTEFDSDTRGGLPGAHPGTGI